jgi:lipopolysaccharide transport system ATP-binding protein
MSFEMTLAADPVPTAQRADSAVLIRAAGLGKSYSMFRNPAHRLRALLLPASSDAAEHRFWALQDVNFELRRGEALGIVGRNGAGKSTLLQLICGTVTPTTGTIQVQGRVAALLELGAGFNPEFSGLENVYLNAALMGLSREQVDAKLDGILAFADIGRFVQQPVKTYSSGMFVRLAFAVATSLEPEILVIDEALSVGDGAFARKSFDRIMQLREAGASVLFCSHTMYHVQALCSRALWLEGGRLRMHDTAARVTSAYETALVAESPLASSPGAHMPVPTGDAPAAEASPAAGGSPAAAEPARITGITASSDNGQSGMQLAVQSGETSLWVEVRFASDLAVAAPTVAFILEHLSGVTVSSGSSVLSGCRTTRGADGSGTIRLHLPHLPLLQGEYVLSIYLMCERCLHVYESAERAISVTVTQTGLERGLVVLDQGWSSLEGDSDGR